jgi:DNA-binding MarR family transcriptional regulator
VETGQKHGIGGIMRGADCPAPAWGDGRTILLDLLVRLPYYNDVKDFSRDAFQLLNTLAAINEKYNLMEKNPRMYGKCIMVYPSQIRAIVAIGHKPGINVTELAQLLEVSKASVSEMITKLEKNGLVRKTRVAGNNKEILLHITSACRVVLEDMDRRHEKIFQDLKSILGEMKETSYEVVIRVLKRFEFYLDEFLRGDTGTSPARRQRAK